MNVYAHCSYIGDTGFNSHSREFFRRLSSHLNLKVRNFTVGKTWEGHSETPHDNEPYINEIDKKILYEQTLWTGNNSRAEFKMYSSEEKNFFHDFNIVLEETDHHFFYDNYVGPKIGYVVWESTLLPSHFLEKLREYDEVWVPSKWQKDCMAKQGYDEDKIKIVPEGVDVDVFYPEENINHELTSDGRFKFFLAGRWDYRKSTKEIIETFLKTFTKNEPVDLIISVDNPWGEQVDGFKTTEDRLKFFGFEDERIKIVHFPKREDYVKLLKSCNVFVSCARSEGWNLPLIESMASGVPSIYSNCSGQLEFAEGKGIPVNILYEKSASENSYAKINTINFDGNYYEPDFDNLSEKMRFAFEFYDEVKRNALIESEEIRERFNWETIGEIGYETCKYFYEKIKDYENEDTNQKLIDYIEGPKVEIVGNFKKKYFVEFIDGDANQVIHSQFIENNMWTKCNRKYYTNWVIKVDGKIVDIFNPKNKRVLIWLDSKSIGDTIAWTPYAIQFAKERECKVILSTFHNQWFKGLIPYKDIEFIEPGESTECYSSYSIGWRRDNKGKWKNFEHYPNQVNLIPLQQTATDILGLKYQELNYGINFKKFIRPISKDYFVFGPNATSGCKEWSYENWVELSKLLKNEGYEIFTLTKNKFHIDGVTNIYNKSWEDVANYLFYAKGFVGLGSGLSWFNWALGKHTFMINGFAKPGHEFTSHQTRIYNDNTCIFCWNDEVFNFDAGDWDWCPVYKGTTKQHICQRSITPQQVLKKIKEYYDEF